MHYILITFYNRGDTERPCWEVYGHRGLYDNDLLSDYWSEQDAMFEAHSYLLPVMKGVSNSMQIEPMLISLANNTK